MKQVLSQKEIDSLLNALTSGEIDTEDLKEEKEDRVKSYDFRRPIKLSKEHVNTLYMVFENFAKIAGNLLSSQIHTNVDISLGAVEQISYDEFIKSIPKTTLLGIFKSKPLTGVQILEIHPRFCMQAVEFTCGGIDSYNPDLIKSKDEFTDIELGVLKGVVETVLSSFENAWSEVINVKTEIDHLETNPQLVQSMSPNEPVILISFAIEVLKLKSFMNICIPFVSFEKILDKLSFRSWFDFDTVPDEQDSQILKDRIVSADVDLDVLLGKAIINVDDFLKLEDGDIIKLDTNLTDPLVMYIEGKAHYLVQPGKFADKIAVQVLEYIEEDVD
ncbi:MAG TPA: flagellar motor switch protein FliM [Tissierellaceae bacterium]